MHTFHKMKYCAVGFVREVGSVDPIAILASEDHLGVAAVRWYSQGSTNPKVWCGVDYLASVVRVAERSINIRVDADKPDTTIGGLINHESTVVADFSGLSDGKIPRPRRSSKVPDRRFRCISWVRAALPTLCVITKSTSKAVGVGYIVYEQLAF